MKQLSLLFLLTFAVFSNLYGQSKLNEEKGVYFADFDKFEHDFGKITDEQDAFTTFRFVNNKPQTLILNPPKTSCGCTVPQYDKEPVVSGAEGEIKVKYSTKGRIGKFVKDIRVYAQGYDEPIRLVIRGEVVAPQEISTLPKKQKNSLFR